MYMLIYLFLHCLLQPLIESNNVLAETIGKITVHCLYHRSGCPWQGPLSECTSHCSGCAFGNSPVVCNRCGTQIVHRQVQEHAQNCPVSLGNYLFRIQTVESVCTFVRLFFTFFLFNYRVCSLNHNLPRVLRMQRAQVCQLLVIKVRLPFKQEQQLPRLKLL